MIGRSRDIPPYEPPAAAGLFARIALGLFLAATIVLVARQPVWLPLLAGLALASWLVGLRWERQLRALAATREGLSICDFARSFPRGTDPAVIRVVHEEAGLLLGPAAAGMPLRAGDRLAGDLGFGPDDIGMDLAVRIAERTGRSLADLDANPVGRGETLGDLVRFFDAQPKARMP